MEGLPGKATADVTKRSIGTVSTPRRRATADGVQLSSESSEDASSPAAPNGELVPWYDRRTTIITHLDFEYRTLLPEPVQGMFTYTNTAGEPLSDRIEYFPQPSVEKKEKIKALNDSIMRNAGTRGAESAASATTRPWSTCWPKRMMVASHGTCTLEMRVCTS